MKSINLIKFLFINFLFLFLAKPAFAGFGVSPADIYNDHLKPGAKFEKEIVLSRSEANEDLKVVIETELGEAESWFNFTPGREFIFSKGQSRYSIKVNVNVDKNADIKNYKGVIRIKASSIESKNSGVSIVKGARMEVNLVTTSINIDTLNIKSLNIPTTDYGKPIMLAINAENSGNTEVAPSKVILEVQNLTKNIIDTQETTKLEKIDPNTTKEIFAQFKNNLDGGEYFGLVKIYLDDKLIHSDRLVFKINKSEEILGQDELKKNTIIKQFVNLVKNNKVETVAIILLPVIPIGAGLAVYKFGILLFAKKLLLTGTIVYSIIGIVLLSLYHFQWKPANMAKPGDVGFVKGETTEIITSSPNQSQSSPLNVNKTPGYPVYRSPDLNSFVIYIAQENEKLKVVKEQDNWYQVLVGSGSGGWLPKNSVKTTE